MIELYGNKIWNSNTPNKYKKVIIASEDSLDNICQELENSGLNYCAYIFNGEAHIAIGRATANNIDKLDIDYQTVIECNSKVYKTNNIIGTTTYDSIEDKLYRKYNTDFAYKIGQRLTEQGILFSGRIYGKTTTITVDKQYADTLNKISAELKEQRASFMSKSEVVQNESPEESKSVNEKISELHFNESQLSALAPSVKFIQTRNDDNLTDNFVSLFSDCTDFYESQLSALAEIYVDTYRSFSDKSLIFADTSRFNDLKQRFVNDNITAKLTENRGYSTTQFEIIREMVTYGMSESVINLLDYTFSIDEMQNFFTAYKNGSYEDLINLIADIKGTTRTDIEGQIEGGTYTPALPDFNTLEKTLYFQESEVESITYMYYNPDAYSGGQFVITEVSYKQIAEANKEYGDDFSGFFDFLDTTGEQRLIDIGSESFRTAIKKFYSGTEFAEGLNADIQHKLVELAVVPEIKLPEVRKIELIKVGDFYEVRGENAKTVADILDLVSTTRNINGSSVDTVGFPDFKLNDNTELLKTQGFTVNIKYEELAPFYEEHDELDDIDPAVIRQQLEDKVNAYPEERKKLLLDIGNISKDMETVKNIPFDVKTESYRVGITIGKDAYSLLDDESRKVAAKALTNAVAQVKGDANKNKRIAIGGLGNFGVEVINDGYFLDKITATLRGNYTYSVELGVSSIINLKKIENLLFKVENVLNDKKSELNKLDIDYKTAQNMLHKPFEYEDELNNSTKRLDELTTALNIDMSEHKVDKPKKTHYFGKDFILGKKKSSKQIQNNEVMKSEPKRSEPEL